MPRYALALTVLFSFAGSSALGQIGIEGSVLPASPISFPTPFFAVGQAPYDTDSDGILDWLTTGGNGRAGLDLRFIASDPQGLNADGLPWNAIDVWRGYETPQNILVGDAGQTGTLSISAGGELRYQYLVLGGYADDNTNGAGNSTTFETAVGERPTDFDLGTHLTAAEPGTGGYGTMIISGAGSLYNNDPNIIPTDLQAVLNLAAGAATNDDVNETVTDLDAAVFGGTGTYAVTERETNQGAGFDVIVGLNGGGDLRIENGGGMEVQDAFMVAVDQQSTGNVVIDGAGSFLSVYGREEFDGTTSGPARIVESTQDATSFIGGGGAGTMTISNGGRATFKNGLSVGRAIGSDFNGVNRIESGSDGSGVLTVTGAGSSLRVEASSITGGEGMTFDGNVLALSIGQKTTVGGLDLPVAENSTNLQPGVLEIEDGAVVTAGFDDDYGTSDTDANVAIGKTGRLSLADGTLSVGNKVFQDGTITGYGTVRARELENSVHSLIQGQDRVANLPESAQPLRIVLNDDITNTVTSFTNRGRVEGFVELEAAGAVVNTGTMDGDFDFEVTGAWTNGDNLTSAGTGSNGGVIRGSGVISTGTFVNHRLGEVYVGAGDSLSILATSAATRSIANAVVEDGATPAGATGAPATADFYMANLGNITVDGGTLELGRVQSDTTIVDIEDTEHENLFRNARYINPNSANDYATEESLGVITSNDGVINFRNGAYNTGVMAFTGGDNVVSGRVFNAGAQVDTGLGPDGIDGNADDFETGIDYDTGAGFDVRPGVILVSGDGTTATFNDTVYNSGLISIGPSGNVVNFLGDLVVDGGEIQVSTSPEAVAGAGDPFSSAFIVVSNTVSINGGALVLPGGPVAASAASASASASYAAASSASASGYEAGYSVDIVSAGAIAEGSLFTDLSLPELADGLFWDIVYDEANGEVFLEVIESLAFGADFTGDGIVSQDDVDVWARNAGVESGASLVMGDADLDGDVDLFDYDILQSQLLDGVPSAVFAAAADVNVPEPTTLLLAGLAAFGAGARRRGC